MSAIYREITFISASQHHVFGLLSTGDVFLYRHFGENLTLVRGMPQFCQGTRAEADRGRGIFAMCGARRIVHDYSRRDGMNVVMMKYNGSDGIILVRKDGVWLWQGGDLWGYVFKFQS